MPLLKKKIDQCLENGPDLIYSFGINEVSGKPIGIVSDIKKCALG